MILCDYCSHPAIVLMSLGENSSRRFCCIVHRSSTRHYETGLLDCRRTENDWARQSGVLYDDVLARFRNRIVTGHRRTERKRGK